jgi:hypothetical protein
MWSCCFRCEFISRSLELGGRGWFSWRWWNSLSWLTNREIIGRCWRLDLWRASLRLCRRLSLVLSLVIIGWCLVLVLERGSEIHRSRLNCLRGLSGLGFCFLGGILQFSWLLDLRYCYMRDWVKLMWCWAWVQER